MLPARLPSLRDLGYSAVGWVVLALLRTSLRVAAIPRPPAEAAAVLGQVLLASLPWLLAAPAVVALSGELPWPRGARGRAAAVHAAAALTLSLADAGWAWLVLPLAGYPMTLPAPVFYLVRLDQALFLYLCLLGIGLALRHRRRHDQAAARAARLESRLLHARLHILELQLHPHFLFNTLNAVSELVHRDAAAARAVLADLRELLGRSLDPRAGQEIPLREELALLEPYARIQRTRFAGSLEIVVEVDAATLAAAVPRLLLQPLVENAIRHGIACRAGPGRVTVRASTRGDRLALEVEDDGGGLGDDRRREGVGLGNTRARLQQLHGGRASLALLPGRVRGAVARLEMPLRLAAPTPPDVGDEPEQAPAPGPGADAGTPRARLAVALAALWLLVAVVGAHADLAAGWLTGDPTSLAAVLGPRLLEAMLWLALTAPVVAVAARLARSALGWPRIVAAHVAVALATVALHLGLVRTLSGTAMGGNLVATLLVKDLCVYAALAAGAHAWTVGRSAAAQDAATARLDAELAAARLELLRWRLHPDVLFGALERIGDLATTDPDRADELTGRLGELLRDMLRAGATTPLDERWNAYLTIESTARSVA